MGSQRAVRAEIALLVALMAMPRGAHADVNDDVQKHIARAAELHQAGKYREALDELSAAYKLSADPALLYAIAQVHVKLDECTLAIDFYQQFLVTQPEAKASAAAHEAIDACKTTLPKIAPKPEPKPEPTPAPVTPAGPGAFYTDVLGDVLVGAGVAGIVVGFVEYGHATSDLDRADAATTYQGHKDLVDQAHSARTIAVIAGIGGALLVGGGVFRFLTRDRAPAEEHGLVIAPTSHGGMVGWSGRF